MTNLPATARQFPCTRLARPLPFLEAPFFRVSRVVPNTSPRRQSLLQHLHQQQQPALRMPAVPTATFLTPRALAPAWIEGSLPESLQPVPPNVHRERRAGCRGPGDPRLDHDMDFIPLVPSSSPPPLHVQAQRHTILHSTCTMPWSEASLTPHGRSVSQPCPYPVVGTDRQPGPPPSESTQPHCTTRGGYNGTLGTTSDGFFPQNNESGSVRHECELQGVMTS